MRVERVEVVERIKTLATKIRFTIEGRQGGERVQRALCVKSFLDEPSLLPVAVLSSKGEIGFYRSVAPGSRVRVPYAHYAQLNRTTGNGVLIMEDVVAGGGRFLTALSPYSVDQASSSLEQLAVLHAEHWAGRGVAQFESFHNRLAHFVDHPYLPTDVIQSQLDDPRGEQLSPPIRDAGRLVRGMTAAAAFDASQPPTLLHGDAHAGNIFERDGESALVDWQVLQRSNWALDVAYHIGAVLSVEDRERHERELLHHYLARLRENGVSEPPDPDTAWKLYRMYMVYAYYMWAITRSVAPAITNEFTKRLGTAVDSLETFHALGV